MLIPSRLRTHKLITYTANSTTTIMPVHLAPASNAGAAALLVLGLLALASPVTAFLVGAGPSQPLAAPAATTTTRLGAHSHLHAALDMMRQQGPGHAGGGKGF